MNQHKIIAILVISVCLINSIMCKSIEQQVENVEQVESEDIEPRTFGHHFLKRVSFALIPASFVVGVITTLLAALTVVSIKGLGVGMILLILTVGQLMARNLPTISGYSAPAPAPIPVVYKAW
uniref:CSON010365 protein n=1 Tax=Culicoides sonorensis TaxID=179676 RepID=A0A336LPN9_CULSO